MEHVLRGPSCSDHPGPPWHASPSLMRKRLCSCCDVRRVKTSSIDLQSLAVEVGACERTPELPSPGSFWLPPFATKRLSWRGERSTGRLWPEHSAAWRIGK
eukprot:g775.t1